MFNDEIAKNIPSLGKTVEITNEEKIAYIKFFSPFIGWEWYVCECQKLRNGDYIFFGLVKGIETEWGYFTLSELQNVIAMDGKLPLVERDKYFEPQKIKDLI